MNQAQDAKQKLSRNYDRAAWFYETAARIYSTNQIRSSKRFQLKYIAPGVRVLYLGVGTGEDAIMAAEAGADVTCIDISHRMLDKIRDRMEQRNLTCQLICEDIFQWQPQQPYTVVAANYFLNVFRRQAMIEMLNRTARFVSPGGRYLIADVALPQGNALSRGFNLAYLKMAMASFWMMGLVPWHENYDYPAFFREAGLELEHVEYFRFAKRGPVLFQSIVAQRTGS